MGIFNYIGATFNIGRLNYLLFILLLTSCNGAVGPNQIDDLLDLNKNTNTATPTATGPSYSLEYDDTSFNEASANDGSISNTVTITLNSSTAGAIAFTGTNGDDLVALGKVTVSNVPTGLTAYMTKISNTSLTFGLSGNANSHTQADDVSNIQVIFSDSAFNGAIASRVVNYSKSGLSISYNALAITYSTTQFTEAGANDGTIGNTITLDVSGDTYTGSNSDDFLVAGKATIGNVPGGLTATLVRISSTRLELTLSGSATNHLDSDDISNLTLTFQDSAFTTNPASDFVNYSRSNLIVNFINPVAITYSTSSLSESGDNDGSIDETITLTLSNDLFTGANGSDLLAAGKVSVGNLPAGLTAVVTKDSSTQATISFTGNAAAHASANSIANLTFTFALSAFTYTTNITLVSNYLKNDISLTFYNTASLSFSASTFSEDTTNIGTVGTTSSITLANDTFTGSNGENMVATGKVSVSNLPTGLSLVITKNSSTTATISISGTALSHANANDVSNLTLTWDDSAFSFNNLASNVVNYAKNDFVIDFLDLYQLSYSITTFDEAAANDGSITATATLTLMGTTWNAIVGTNLVGSGQVVVSNVAAGLTASAVVATATTVTLSFSGNAAPHTNTQDVTNVTLVFGNSAFSSGSAAGVQNSTYTNVYLDFDDPASLSYSSSTFNETSANTGAISNNISIVLSNNTFDGAVAEDFVASAKLSVSNVPAGLTAVATYVSNTALSLSLTGNATSHINADDISNLTLTFQASAFSNGVATNVSGYSKNDFVVDFLDPASLAYSATSFSESSTNNGSISTTATITLSNDTFTGVNTDDFVAGGKISVSNLPAGLGIQAIRNSSSTLALSFTGNAAAHESANDVSNLTLTFAVSAFTNNTVASNVSNYAKNDLIIDFANAPSLAYSATTLTENEVNDGSVTETLVLTLTGDTLTGVNTDDFLVGAKATLSNLPAGLTATLVRDSSTQLTLSLGANAASHVAADSISNLGLTFLDGAFTNTSTASNVTNYLKNNLQLTFLDPHSLSLSSTTFSESSSDDGSIGNSITFTLNGTTFTGSTSDNFISGAKVFVTNAPAGHTPVVTKVSDTSLTFQLQGTASAHYSADTITNLTYVFDDTAFNAGNASAITNYSKNDLNVAYFAGTVAPPASLSISNTTSSTATLTWTDSSYNEEGFFIEQCNGVSCSSGSWVAAAYSTAIVANTATYSFSSLTEGNYYRYRIRSFHDEDTSAWVYADTNIAFGGIHTTDDGDGSLNEMKTIDCREHEGAYAIIKWSEITGASSYLVFDTTSGSDVLIATVPAGTNYYVATNLLHNTSYSFNVKVIMGSTAIMSNNDNDVSLTTDVSFSPCGVFPPKTLKGGATRINAIGGPTYAQYYGGKLYLLENTNYRLNVYDGMPVDAQATPSFVLGQQILARPSYTAYPTPTPIGISSAPVYVTAGNRVVNSSNLNTANNLWVGSVGGTDRLLIADTGNHRVLIYNTLPTTDYAGADLVLGQPNFSSSTADNTTRTKGMQSPNSVWSDGTRIFVSDASNHRILIWNSWPTSNFQAPDIYLGQATTTGEVAGACDQQSLNTPRGVITVGTKLIVSDSAHHRILIYNDYTAFASGAIKPNADIVIGGGGAGGTAFTTCTAGTAADRFNAPRDIFYDTTNDDLYIADTTNHRVKVFTSGVPTVNNASSDHVLCASNIANTNGNQAGRCSSPYYATVVNNYSGTDDMVIIADYTNHRFQFLKSIPSASGQAADFYIGKAGAGLAQIQNYLDIDEFNLYNPFDVEYHDDKLYVADYNHNRVLVWDSIPSAYGTPPSYVLGQANFNTSAAGNSQSTLAGPIGVCAGDNILFVVENTGDRVSMYSLPISSNGPNKIGVLGQTSWAGTAAGNGTNQLEAPRDCFYDETNNILMVTEFGNDRVSIYENFLANFQAASGGGAIDGVGTDYAQLTSTYILGDTDIITNDQSHLQDPSGIFYDGSEIIVTDSAKNRALIFDYPVASTPLAKYVLGQQDFTSVTLGNTQQGLNNPRGVVKIGTKIYIAEYTGRRISIWESPTSDGESKLGVIGQSSYTTAVFDASSYLPVDAIMGIDTDSSGTRIFGVDYLTNRLFWIPAYEEGPK